MVELQAEEIPSPATEVSAAMVNEFAPAKLRVVDRTVIWDDQCGFCAASVRALRALDWFGALRFEGSSDPAALARYAITREEANAGLQYIDAAGRKSGYDAAVKALAATPVGFLLSIPMRFPPIRWIGRRIYGWVARNRRCILPSLV